MCQINRIGQQILICKSFWFGTEEQKCCWTVFKSLDFPRNDTRQCILCVCGYRSSFKIIFFELSLTGKIKWSVVLWNNLRNFRFNYFTKTNYVFSFFFLSETTRCLKSQQNFFFLFHTEYKHTTICFQSSFINFENQTGQK